MKRKDIDLSDSNARANDERERNRVAFEKDKDQGNLEKNCWYLYYQGQKIAQAATQHQLLALPESNGRRITYAFHTLVIPPPIQRGFIGSVWAK